MRNVGKDAGGGWGGNTFALLAGLQTGPTSMEPLQRFLKKLKIELSVKDPAIPSLGMYPKEIKREY